MKEPDGRIGVRAGDLDRSFLTLVDARDGAWDLDIEKYSKGINLFFDSCSLGLLVCNPDFSLIEVNPGFCQMLGFEKEEILMLNWNDFVNQKDIGKISGHIRDVRKGRIDKFNTKIRFINKRGSIVYSTFSTVCIRDENENVDYFLSSVINTSKLHETKERIKQEKTILRTIVNNLPLTVYIIDKDGLKMMSNKSDWEMLGYKNEDEVLGKTDIELFPGEIGEQCHADNMHVINDRTPILNKTEKIIDKDGADRWLITSKIPLPATGKENQAPGLLGIGMDVTERRRLRQQVVESEAYYRTLIEISPDAIFVCDLEAKFTFLSKNMYHFLNYPENVNLIGKSIFNFVASVSHDKVKEDYTNDLNGKRPSQLREYKCLKYDGTEFWGEFSSSPLSDTSGTLIGFMIVCRDITHRKKVEMDLITAKDKAEESDNLKTAMLHNISHEIRTPLNGIVGFSSLLNEPGLSSEAFSSYISTIQSCSEQLLSIITDLIDISSIEAKIIKQNNSLFDLNQLLKDIWFQFELRAKSRNLNLNLKVKFLDESLIIMTDKTKLVQIISNLLNNAFKFTFSGQIEFGYCLKESEIEFYVSDTGIGIPPEYHTRIFDTFYQVDYELSRKYNGAGLGLSICKAYTELLEGKIWVNSEQGKGSTFFFKIPLHTVD